MLGVALTAVVVTVVAARVQERGEALDVRTALVDDMSSSLASAIGIAGLGARGDVTEPASRRALGEWVAARGRIGAELAGRFPGDEIVQAWRAYGRAVGDYIRLGGVTIDREALLGYLSSYARRAGVAWGDLAPASGLTSGAQFVTAYDRLGDWLLRRGGELVAQIVESDPAV